MKVVILTHRNGRHFYLCNRLIESGIGVSGVVLGAKQVNRSFAEKLSRRLRKGSIYYSARNSLYNLFFAESLKRLNLEKEQAERESFGGEEKIFHTNYGKLRIATVARPQRSINDQYYIDLINVQKPDVLVVMGTCLIGSKLMRIAPLMLNIHTGLSPYYRGGNTNFWPFLYNEHKYFGVTVHKMSLGIDAGEIVYSERIIPTQEDNFGSINCKAIKLGTQLMIDALRLYANGELKTQPQWVGGKLFHNHDMNGYSAWRYYRQLNKMSDWLSQANLQEDPVTVKAGILSASIHQ